jgi:hypothetical protein
MEVAESLVLPGVVEVGCGLVVLVTAVLRPAGFG